MQDLISIIVPVYKVEKYLDNCIQSIVDQTYTNLEIILIDDGSPDNCPQMCDDWAKKDYRIKVIHKENGGVSLARNVGLNIASGEYIGFVDSDDWLEPNMYQNMLQSMINNSVGMVECGYYVEGNGKNQKKSNIEYISKVYTGQEVIDIIVSHSKKFEWFLWCKLFKKSLIKNIRFQNDIKIFEDMLFCLEYLKNAKSVCLIEDKYYHYVRNTDSALYNFKQSHITANYAVEKILELDLNLTKDSIDYFKLIAVGRASVYVTSSYAHLKNDEENIEYARQIIKKYYSDIKKNKSRSLNSPTHRDNLILCIRRIAYAVRLLLFFRLGYLRLL
ncbi:MAG: glycosyltransferase [Clostridia bacterium]